MQTKLKQWLLLTALFFAPFTVAYAAPSDASTPSRSNLGLFVFIHDQVSAEERAELGSGYLNTFLEHMEDITGRKMIVTIIKDKPGVTDFDFRGDNLDELLEDWASVSGDYADDNNLPRPSDRHKYMLLTTNKVNWLTHGISRIDLNVGISSTRMYNTIGHEIGHLFNAQHEAADGFPCQTIMWGGSTSTIIPCYYFSEANQNAIREYLSDTP